MEKQCQTILKLVQGLLVMGVNCHLPRAVVHGPRIFQELNILNLYSKQMIMHIQTILIWTAHIAPNGCVGEGVWQATAL